MKTMKEAIAKYDGLRKSLKELNSAIALISDEGDMQNEFRNADDRPSIKLLKAERNLLNQEMVKLENTPLITHEGGKF